jgi:hypothetical protein
MSPPALFLASLWGMGALAVLAPGPSVLPRPANLLGAIPVLLGMDGVYGVTRNPMYLAGLLILGGAGVVLASATPFLAVPAFAWAVRNGYILREERMLEERFGSAYDEYRSRVRRWI